MGNLQLSPDDINQFRNQTNQENQTFAMGNKESTSYASATTTPAPKVTLPTSPVN